MGYDPDISRSKDGAAYIYKILGEDGETRRFKTLRSITEHRSLCITGRMTRVWEAIEVNTDDENPMSSVHVALKDVWLENGAKTEKQIQDEIFGDISRFAASDFYAAEHLREFPADMKKPLEDALRDEEYKKYFLHIECDYQGRISKNVPSSAHAEFDLFSTTLSTSHSVAHPSLRTSCDPTREIPLKPLSQPRPVRKFVPKQQYRVVYKEVCKALHELDSLSVALNVLEDCLIGKL